MSRLDQTREPELHERSREQERDKPQISRVGGDDEGMVKALRNVGMFRVVDQKDLPKAHAAKLIKRGLVERKTLYPAGGVKPGEKPHELLTLTDKGEKLLEQQRTPEDRQRFWRGAVKPREANHDLSIFRAYEKESEEIEQAGGQVRRVVVDFEFKREINAKMNALDENGNPPDDEMKSARRKDLASQYDLPLIDDKLMLPDARIEYVDADGREQHRDIEVVTKHYRGSMRSAKQQSGFRLHNASDPRAAVRDDHNLNLFG